MNQAEPKKKKSKKKWLWLIPVALVAVIVIMVLNMSNQLKNSYQEETVTARDIATYYSFSGNLSPVTDKEQTSKEAIKVKEVYVQEGEVVEQGRALLRGTDGTRIYAAESGTIETLYIEVDDQLAVGSPVARIVNYDTLEVSIDVDEYDIGALALGREGSVYLNALDRTVPGVVSEIAREATTSGGVSYYSVKMHLDAGDDIRSGMSVEVKVLKEEAPGCLALPLKALSYDEYNKPFVYVKDEKGEMTARHIILGVSDGQYAQVTEGVQANETIYYMEDVMKRFYQMQQSMMQNMR